MSDAPFYLHRSNGQPGLILICDHAGREIPADYGDLGLPNSAFERHIAYDIGAADLTRALADAFDAPALLGRYSRLFIDLNRGADDPTLIMKLSDGQIVPGNAQAGPAEFAKRIAMVHAPYHGAISAQIARGRASGKVPILISIHSFTPHWRGAARPWEVAILHAPRDRRLADLMLTELRSTPGLCVGDNQPYSGALENDTLSRHGLDEGLPHVLIEVRQDLIASPDGVAAMAQLIAPCLRRSIAALSQEGILTMNDTQREKAEAAAFRRLVQHLRQRTDVQNIDLMTLAGFCRNCLGDWYAEAATQAGAPLDKAAGREAVYGMPVAEWKAKHQRDATPEQQAAFAKAQKASH
jgi:predicted N-formylglutamate amidohydrolase